MKFLGSTASKGGELKLVHPGGFVEVHHSPVSAAQVMAKNPRHFVTRPDVFKFPWIVVRPESLLKPGNVYFIVPCHTVYRLLRSAPSHPSPRRRAHEEGQMRPLAPPETEVAVVKEREGAAKSCLKKPGSSRTPGGLRVAFELPRIEEDDRVHAR